MLPTLLVELVLRQTGFRVVQLGNSLPVKTIISAVETLQPDLMWLSVSEISDEATFLHSCERLSQTAGASCEIVLGGHALADRLRLNQMQGTYLDNLQQLVGFAESRWKLQSHELSPAAVGSACGSTSSTNA